MANESTSNSRLFNPGYASPKEKDSMLVQAPVEAATHGARRSQTGMSWANSDMKVGHISNRK